MKFTYKLILLSLVFIGLSCSNLTDLDINQNPNAPSPDQAEPQFLFNAVQLGMGEFFSESLEETQPIVRQRHMNSFFYNTFLTAERFDDIWLDAYTGTGVMQNAVTLEALIADEPAFSAMNAATKILRSYVMTSIVDLFGDVPFTEAFQGTDIISPNVDSGSDVYAAAIATLDEAIALLENANGPLVQNDLFFGGDPISWLALANTLKMRIYNNTRLVDSEAGSKIAAIISEGNFIGADAFDDFDFQFGSERTDPDSRHPGYVSDYEADDGGYMANYFMWLLVGDKEVPDPRTRFYFYRQQPAFTETSIDLNNWDCVVTNGPFDAIPPGQLDHVFAVDPNLPFCLASAAGYMGRDHGNGQGIPPDGPNRVEYGVYPAGGSWDDNSFSFTQTDGDQGGLGEGIHPIWSAAFTHFLRAEAALEAGTGEDPREQLELGVRASISKVLGFESLIPAATLTRVIGSTPTGEDILANTLIPSDSIVTDYVNAVLDRYDAASDKLDVVMNEFYIASFGNGIEAYNLYRRTGKPNNMAPLIDAGAASTASFPRTMPYPNSFVTRNANVSQRETTTQVFWDTNPAGFIR